MRLKRKKAESIGINSNCLVFLKRLNVKKLIISALMKPWFWKLMLVEIPEIVGKIHSFFKG